MIARQGDPTCVPDEEGVAGEAAQDLEGEHALPERLLRVEELDEQRQEDFALSDLQESSRRTVLKLIEVTV